MIYYVGAYRTEHIQERDPQGSVAEDAKMAYIISALKSMGEKLTVVSVLASLKRGFHKRKVCPIDRLETQVFLESLDETRSIVSKLGVIQRLTALFLYLLFHAGANDHVIVYNTQLYSVPVRLAKWFKRFRLTLEVEEIFYLDNRNPKDVQRAGLEKSLIRAADQYITASQLLADRISEGKPTAVVYGSYEVPPVLTQRQEDGCIHVVYAGGIDSLRRVDLAVKAFEMLPENYRLHVLGYGDDAALKQLQEQIRATNTAAGFEKAEYVGCLHGEEYDRFLQSCHIGLNMQVIGASIEDVAYPSKISSYLSRGLSVVSSALNSIINSPFADYVTFYKESAPEQIAQAIENAEIHTPDFQKEAISAAEQTFLIQLKQFTMEET